VQTLEAVGTDVNEVQLLRTLTLDVSNCSASRHRTYVACGASNALTAGSTLAFTLTCTRGKSKQNGPKKTTFSSVAVPVNAPPALGTFDVSPATGTELLDVSLVHMSAESISAVQGLIHLNDNTFMEYYNHSLKITLIDTAQKHSLTLQFDPPEMCGPADGRYHEWKEALTANLRLYTALVQNAEATIDTVRGIPNHVKEGLLRMRPPKGGDSWPEHRFFINEHAMVVVDKEPEDPCNARIIGEYLISPTCR